MANPGNAFPYKSLDPEQFKLGANFTLAAGANPTAQDVGNGIQSITRTGAGVIRILLREAWSGVADYSVKIVGATPTFGQITADNSALTTGANARSIDITFFQESAGVLTANDSAAMRALVTLTLKNRVARR